VVYNRHREDDTYIVVEFLKGKRLYWLFSSWMEGNLKMDLRETYSEVNVKGKKLY
jgi:hypothetical protein